jgi:hypothetical protein
MHQALRASFNNAKRRLAYRRAYMKWRLQGKPLPPPHLAKQVTVKRYQKEYGLHAFVETGTYLGEMIEAQRNRFEKLISVEVSAELHARAVEIFKSRSHVTLLLGDSGELMPGILERLEGRPALFWLDGHYSGGNTGKGQLETPIAKELNAILASPAHHVVLVDDARLFNGTDDYPTLETVAETAARAGYAMAVADDIIRLVRRPQ